MRMRCGGVAAEATPPHTPVNGCTGLPVTSLIVSQIRIVFGTRIGEAWPRPLYGHL